MKTTGLFDSELKLMKSIWANEPVGALSDMASAENYIFWILGGTVKNIITNIVMYEPVPLIMAFITALLFTLLVVVLLANPL